MAGKIKGGVAKGQISANDIYTGRHLMCLYSVISKSLGEGQMCNSIFSCEKSDALSNTHSTQWLSLLIMTILTPLGSCEHYISVIYILYQSTNNSQREKWGVIKESWGAGDISISYLICMLCVWSWYINYSDKTIGQTSFTAPSTIWLKAPTFVVISGMSLVTLLTNYTSI